MSRVSQSVRLNPCSGCKGGRLFHTLILGSALAATAAFFTSSWAPAAVAQQQPSEEPAQTPPPADKDAPPINPPAPDQPAAKPVVTPPAPAAPSAVPQANLPKAADIIAKYIEAIGGKDAIMKHKSRMMKGEMKFAEQSAPLTIFSMADPDRMQMLADVPGQGQIRETYDGVHAWVLMPQGGPQIIDGPPLDSLKEQADFYEQLHLDRKYSTMETVAQVPFNGKDAYEVKCTGKDGQSVNQYFDVKSGLLVGKDEQTDLGGGPMTMVTAFDEYKEFDGVKLALLTTMTMKDIGMSQSLHFTDVEVNKVDPKIFDMPEEVKKLIEAQKTPGQPAAGGDKADAGGNKSDTGGNKADTGGNKADTGSGDKGKDDGKTDGGGH